MQFAFRSTRTQRSAPRVHKRERVAGLVFVSTLALLVYTMCEMLCRCAGHHITARHALEQFERLAATSILFAEILFADGSRLTVPAALRDDSIICFSSRLLRIKHG